jgi:regulatory protein
LQKKKKYISKDDALLKLQAYCAYQDRCHSEVRSKLLDLGIYGDDLEDIIVALIEDNFLNEERYARSYARGKFRIKQWGRLRIRRELKFRKISDYCIRKAMEEIDENDYHTKY